MATRAKDRDRQAPVSMQEWALFRLASQSLDETAETRQILYGQHGGADLPRAHDEHKMRHTFPVPDLGPALPNPAAAVNILASQHRRDTAYNLATGARSPHVRFQALEYIRREAA